MSARIQWREGGKPAAVHAYEVPTTETPRSKALTPLCGRASAALALRDVTSMAADDMRPQRACKACIRLRDTQAPA